MGEGRWRRGGGGGVTANPWERQRPQCVNSSVKSDSKTANHSEVDSDPDVSVPGKRRQAFFSRMARSWTAAVKYRANRTRLPHRLQTQRRVMPQVHARLENSGVDL